MNLPTDRPWVVFMFGLPGSGKSTWINENMKEHDHVLVSADKIKDEMVSGQIYGHMIDLSSIHEESVEKAEKLFTDSLVEQKNIVFDGGGINNSYNIRLAVKARDLGYHRVLVVIDTPAKVCIERNRKRDRDVPVPEEAIIRKAVIFKKCLQQLSAHMNNVIRKEYYTNEYLFVDMDGTLAAYQYMPLDEYDCIDFANGQYFKYVEPVWPVIEKVREYQNGGNEIHILSAIPDNECEAHKNKWLDDYAPFIRSQHRHYIGNKRYKYVMLRNLIKRMKIQTHQVTLIDDDPAVLQSVNEAGINAIHPSMFLSERY